MKAKERLSSVLSFTTIQTASVIVDINNFFSNCAIVGNFQHASPALQPVVNALLFQCRSLGIQVENHSLMDAGTNLPLTFITPDFESVECRFSFWSDSEQRAGCETTLQAATGLMSVHGRATGKAQPIPLPYLSTVSATLALQACLATALARRRGLGISRSRVSMASAGLLCAGQYLAGATTGEDAEEILPGHHDAGLRPPFRSADGVRFELETLSADPWRRLCDALGLEPVEAGRGWQSFLQRYAKGICPLPERLHKRLAKLSFAQVTRICSEAGVALCRQRTIEERARDSDVEELLQSGPWQLHPATPTDTPLPPPRGQDLPLSGLTVVESCRRIQGPMAGHLLSLLGARVIRIEPPGGDPLRGMPPLVADCSARFDALNHHKEVIEIDIKSAAGRAQLVELVSDAQVFLHNWAPGKAEELGLDYRQLAAASPGLVYTHAGAWGQLDGALDIPGTDFTVQAYSGLADLIGRTGGHGGGTLFTALDLLGGILAAQGVLLGLLSRSFCHRGGEANTSLLGAATLLGQPHLHACRMDTPLLEPPLAKAYGNLVIENLRDLPQQSHFNGGLHTDSYTRVTPPWRFS
ncbi:CoA transferase [Microbulbifer sp.]|uniref:CoA transferase n=1 Tax=Microbulbifer sp. TaxID=1908541 RepID=UPI002588CC15|nr:CoA transferase [Microbulbifer sp.]